MRIGLLFLLPLTALCQHSSTLEHGRAVYRSNCAFCHGTDGRGGRGPNLVSAPLTHGDGDADIAKVVRGGVPGSSMPSFSSMENDDMAHLIEYLRSLSGHSVRQVAKLGDPMAGRAVYDRSGCAGCHRIGDAGSVYGPDLSRIGGGRSVEYLRESLKNPSADIPPEYEGVTVVTADGKRITGIRVNEDTFTIQVRLPSQRFASFRKNEAREVVYEKKSIMPSYAHLSEAETNNLLEYLLGARGQVAGESKRAEGIR